MANGDTQPTPGQGYYYVTAATFQGETRYGRKAEGGQLGGREPALGSKRGEKKPLLWNNVHLERDNPHVLFTVTKERLDAKLLINSELLSVLGRLRLKSKKTGPSDPVFVNRRGEPIKQAAMLRALKAAAKRAGIKDAAKLRVHDLRHTTCTEIANSREASVQDNMAFLRHRTLETHKKSLHATDEGKQRAANALVTNGSGTQTTVCHIK